MLLTYVKNPVTIYIQWLVWKEEMTGLWIRLTEHSLVYLWHRYMYSITVNHVMMASVKVSKQWLTFYLPLGNFGSVNTLVSSNSLS